MSRGICGHLYGYYESERCEIWGCLTPCLSICQDKYNFLITHLLRTVALTFPQELPQLVEVPIKTEEQLDLQALHRVRERWVMRRTAMVNQIRSLLLERGLTLPKGRSHVDEQLPRIVEDAELNLSDSIRVLLAQLKMELEQLAPRIEEMDRVIQKSARENEACQRLTEIPGVGPVTATALIAAVGHGSAFGKGRKLSV